MKPVATCLLILAGLALQTTNLAGQQSTLTADSRQHALAMEEQGRDSEAEKAWRSVLVAQPDNSEAYAHLGLLQARRGHYAKAIPLYRRALALNPGMAGLEMNLGLALFKSGELQEAAQVFNKLLKAEPPDSAEARRLQTLIGMADYGLQNYAAAIPLLKHATAAEPQNLPFRLILAHSCLAAKQYQCVLDVYREILNLNAESAEADMLAGEALDEMRDHAGATQQFRAAVKANPKEPNVHFGLGYLLWTQGHYDEGAKEFQAELANVPDHAQALVYLADCNLKMGHADLALPLLRKAIGLDPGLEMAHLDLGVAYSDMGQHANALRELQLAAKMSSGDVNAHWRLAQLYRTMGKKEEAKVEFEKTKALTKAADESLSSKLNRTPRGPSSTAVSPQN